MFVVAVVVVAVVPVPEPAVAAATAIEIVTVVVAHHFDARLHRSNLSYSHHYNCFLNIVEHPKKETSYFIICKIMLSSSRK